jgi:hypothetical protein
MSVVDFPVAPEHDESAVVPIVEFQNEPVQLLEVMEEMNGREVATEYDFCAPFR